MNSDSIYQIWPKQNLDSWIEQIKKENPNLEIAQADRKIDDAITVKAFPFYTEGLMASTILSASLPSKHWKCGIHLELTEAKQNNDFLLHALKNGADYISLECNAPIDRGYLDTLLHDIQLDLITSRWNVYHNTTAHEIEAYILLNYPGSDFFINFVTGDFTEKTKHIFVSLPTYNTNSWTSKISDLLTFLSKTNLTSEKLIISINLSHDFLLNVASVRALKLLLLRLETVFRINFNSHFELTIDTSVLNDSINSNLISLSSIALSAALSSPDAIILPASDQTMEYKNKKWLRTSVHLLQILQHEAFLNQTLDPLSGSYSIENLTEQIAEHLWNSIQLSLNYDS